MKENEKCEGLVIKKGGRGSGRVGRITCMMEEKEFFYERKAMEGKRGR